MRARPGQPSRSLVRSPHENGAHRRECLEAGGSRFRSLVREVDAVFWECDPGSFRDVVYVLRDARGAPAKLRGVMQDITRKRERTPTKCVVKRIKARPAACRFPGGLGRG